MLKRKPTYACEESDCFFTTSDTSKYCSHVWSHTKQCLICNTHIKYSKNWKRHLQTPSHLKKAREAHTNQGILVVI